MDNNNGNYAFGLSYFLIVLIFYGCSADTIVLKNETNRVAFQKNLDSFVYSFQKDIPRGSWTRIISKEPIRVLDLKEHYVCYKRYFGYLQTTNCDSVSNWNERLISNEHILLVDDSCIGSPFPSSECAEQLESPEPFKTRHNVLIHTDQRNRLRLSPPIQFSFSRENYIVFYTIINLALMAIDNGTRYVIMKDGEILHEGYLTCYNESPIN